MGISVTEVIPGPLDLIVPIVFGCYVNAGAVLAHKLPPFVFMATVALVVDDSMLIRFTVCRFLEERGFTVHAAGDGAEAVLALERIRPGLVVTDMDMPKMSGSELITFLKSKPETAAIPIIIVAGRASGFDGREKRADYAIYKDIDIEAQLEKALGKVLSHGKGKKATD